MMKFALLRLSPLALAGHHKETTMTKFDTYTADDAPEAAKPTLKAVQTAFGFIPNLQATMAESPELLAGYSTLWDLFSKTTLTPHEQQNRLSHFEFRK
jgi:hypothetical protein